MFKCKSKLNLEPYYNFYVVNWSCDWLSVATEHKYLPLKCNKFAINEGLCLSSYYIMDIII